MDRWSSFLYIYGVGGLVFGAGLWIALKRGALDARSKLLPVLLLGLAGYALLHGLLQSGGAPGPLPVTGKTRGAEGLVGSRFDLIVVGVYFTVILSMGAWFARFTRTSSDFFFGGRRFSAWLVATSCVATTIGAYSFVKYSANGFKFGLSSTMTYLNDWFWMPLWMCVWLPIIYYGRIQSVPEYFERRFGRQARVAATMILLLYLMGYVGINFLTLGRALHALTGWTVFEGAVLAAAATGIYVAVGGQTSVIMTDLLQGLLLLVVGIGLFAAGAAHIGGLTDLWQLLPEPTRLGFTPPTEPAGFPAIGVFWQDAMAGGIAFYFMNQGILMRFLSARSVAEGRKAAALVVLVVMPLAALAVSGVGWIGRAMAQTGDLPADIHPDNVFVIVSSLLAAPGVFGLIMAMLTAALMSTADTLLTAVSAVFVNDIWRPFIRPRLRTAAGDKPDLNAARAATVVTAVLALASVPYLDRFDTIYLAHAAFTATVTPPMATALVLGAVWPRYGHRAALLTLVGGSAAVAASLFFPALIEPFDHGIAAGGEGVKAHKYMRAFYGLAVCSGLAVLGTWIFRRDPRPDPLLTAGPEAEARRAFKGAAFKEGGAAVLLRVHAVDAETRETAGTDEVFVTLHPEDASALGAEAGDLIHTSRPGWWHGGLFSFHGRVELSTEAERGSVSIPRAMLRAAGLRDRAQVVLSLQG